MKIVREHINEIKRDVESSGLGAIGVGKSRVFYHTMINLIDEYDLYYLTEFNPENVYEHELHYQFFSKIVSFMKCKITDLILIDLEGVDESDQANIKEKLLSSNNEDLAEYDDTVATINKFHIIACKDFAIIDAISNNVFGGDSIAVNNTKYKFF